MAGNWEDTLASGLPVSPVIPPPRASVGCRRAEQRTPSGGVPLLAPHRMTGSAQGDLAGLGNAFSC